MPYVERITRAGKTIEVERYFTSRYKKHCRAAGNGSLCKCVACCPCKTRRRAALRTLPATRRQSGNNQGFSAWRGTAARQHGK